MRVDARLVQLSDGCKCSRCKSAVSGVAFRTTWKTLQGTAMRPISDYCAYCFQYGFPYRRTADHLPPDYAHNLERALRCRASGRGVES